MHGVLLPAVAVALLVAAAATALLPRGGGKAGQRAWAALVVAAGLALLGAAVRVLAGGEAWRWSVAWNVPGGEVALGLDALSAFFLCPIAVLGAAGAVYACGCFPAERHPRAERAGRAAWCCVVGAMAAVVMARNAVFFLLAWEGMALAALVAIVAEPNRADVRRVGWLYLVATHTGTLALVAMFALWGRASGSFALEPPASPATAGWRDAVFLLALFGFGVKAGVMPLHVWLPSAHGTAPTHVSALLSGVLIKTGIYGLARMLVLLGPPESWWGPLLLALGVVSSVLGVAWALGQHDIKRLLACHSIENIGIIVAGLGLGVTALHAGRPAWAWLAMAGGLLHVWNHGLFKALLFFGAGAVIHATGERTIDRMGGLAKRMPATAAFFLLGAAAICGLPPLNGFVSEWLIYLGAFRAAGPESHAPLALAGLAAPALALTGALAVACFVKVCGVAFLGEARTPRVAAAREAGASLLAPMAVLAAACAVIGVVPWFFAAPLQRAAALVLGPSAMAALPAGGLAEHAGLETLSAVAAALLAGFGALWWLFGRRRAPGGVVAEPTWDCGYAEPSPRMQYTAASFGRTLVDLFGWALRPQRDGPGPLGWFPRSAACAVHVRDAVLDGLLLPVWARTGRLVERVRVLQRGPVQLYVLYVLGTVVVLLAWALAGGGGKP